MVDREAHKDKTEVLCMKKRRSLTILYILVIAATLLVAEYGSKAVTVIAENTPIEREHTIIIDAGHGGEDGGATSCSGVLESGINLEISLRLNDLFHFLGYDTKMIRTSDISVYTEGKTLSQKKISDLKERVRITNETENAVLLSIHQNNFSDGKYSGAQIFYTDTAGSKELASKLQSTFAATLNPGSKRQCKASDGIYLMEHINCTGILIECGFLSNAEEEARLRSESYQKKLCCVIASSLSTWLVSDRNV